MSGTNQHNLQGTQPGGDRLERGGEVVGSWFSRAIEALDRVVELPANIRVRRTGRPARLIRVSCWVCLIFLPVLWWAWLALLAVASSSNPK